MWTRGLHKAACWYTVNMFFARLCAIVLAVTPAVAFAAAERASLACTSPARMGGVQFSVGSEIVSTVPSADIALSFSLVNNGTSAVDDASLILDVSSEGDAGGSVHYVRTDTRVTVAPGERTQGHVLWNVPKNLPPGEYLVTTLLVPRYVSYPAALREEGVIRSGVPIRISGGISTARFDTTSVRVSGTEYHAPEIVTVSREGDVPVTVRVHNEHDGPYIGAVTWRLYSYDAADETTPVDERREEVALHPDSWKDVTYVLGSGMRGAYLLEGVLSDGVSSSLVRVWLARDGSVINDCARGEWSGTRTLFVLVLGVVALVFGGLAWRFIEGRHQHA